jgi:hypothetical protein
VCPDLSVTDTVTRSFTPVPVIVVTTARADVFPVSGSVASTRSPSSIFSISFFAPSAINTDVPGTKLFAAHDDIGRLPPDGFTAADGRMLCNGELDGRTDAPAT